LPLRLALDDDHEAVVLLEHRLRDFKKLERAARRAHGLHHRGEARVLGIAGDVEVRADVRTALELPAAAVTSEVPPFATTAKLAARTTAESTTLAARRTIAALKISTAETAARGTVTERTLTRRRATATFARARRSAGRLAERATIAGRCACASVITTIASIGSIAVAPLLGCALFYLGPLGAEGEALQLAEVDFI
jgi:hypothetical protein